MNKYLRFAYQRTYWEEHKNRRNYNHEVVNCFAEQRIEFLKRYINLDDVTSALDYGCGDGFSGYYMNRHIPHIEGVDISKTLLEHNPLSKNLLHVFDGKVLPFSDNSFDLVYCWEVLHHVEYPEQALREMTRVASKYVVVFEPNSLNLAQLIFGLIKKEERGTLRFRKSYLTRLAESSGLKIIHAANVGWIFPNVTPVWLLDILKAFPFKFPIFTISCCLIAEKKGLTEHATSCI